MTDPEAMTRRTFAAQGLGLYGARSETPVWIEASGNGEVRRQNWPGANKAVSVGSLLKPFLASAYLQSGRAAPVVECRGPAAGCWKPGGHGRLDLVAAIALSCNVYFLELASALDRAALDSMCLSYGLGSPGRDWTRSRLIGLEGGWPQTPETVVRAFAALAHAGQPVIRPVLAGMIACAQTGTAKDAGFACYAKTGTAECSHGRGGVGDGYAVAMYPTSQPRAVLLVMQHNTTGARAAGALRPIMMSTT